MNNRLIYRPMSRSLLLASLLLAFAPLAGAQPDQRQFTSDRPMEPFPPAKIAADGAAPAEGATGADETAAEVARESGEPVSTKPGAGGGTQAWLDLQASGSAAVGGPRPMPGEVADVVYERYLNSFKHPIPVDFPRQTTSAGGQSGSGGSGN